MVDDIISEMGSQFRKGVFDKKTTFRFLIGDATITVTIDAESYAVEKGAGTGEVDCSCKTSEDMFRKVWYDGYKPGIMDFLGGAIKSDAPLMLPLFLRAFGKEPV
jgi:hypothetical protein